MLFSDEEILSVVVFGLIKLVGYVFVARWVQRYYRPPHVARPLFVAISRIALGAAIAGLVAISFRVDKSMPWYLVLVSARAVEWLLVFWFFYERPTGTIDWQRLSVFTVFGTVVSCVLDLPAGFTAFVIPIMVYGIC